MTLVLLLRFVLIFFLVKLVWSLLTGKKTVGQGKSPQTKKKTKRFDAKGHNVSDGDFEDVK